MKNVSKKGAVIALAALLTLACASQVFAEVDNGKTVTPGSITSNPDAITSNPDAVTSNPDAITSKPDVVTSNPDAITTGADTVETVTDKYVTRYVAADGTVSVQYTDRNNSGTVLKAGDGVLPNGAEFKQSVAKSGTAYDTAAAVSAMLPNTTNFFVYQFDITANGVDIHELSNYVKVTLSRPADLVIGEGQQLVVYRLEDNGTLTRCESAINDHFISFLTNHFSTYIFSVENVNGTATTTDAAAKTANSAVKSPKTGE